jgi:hypothetical protein
MKKTSHIVRSPKLDQNRNIYYLEKPDYAYLRCMFRDLFEREGMSIFLSGGIRTKV